MTFESFLRYGSVWTLILGVLSLAFAVRNYRRQVNAQILFEIAGRYHEMLRLLPVKEWITKDEVPASTPELTASVLRYLSIVRFAFVLHELRYLSKDLWKLLQAEHHRTLATPLFVREWKTLHVEFAFFPNFLAYVESTQREPRPSADRADDPKNSYRHSMAIIRENAASADRGRPADSEFPG
jgi:hypothetical protein